MEIKERLEELKKINEIDPPKRKKGCSECKKKPKVIEKLELTEEEPIEFYTLEDIKLAYHELTSFGGVKEDKKEFIKKVYKYIFNEEFDFNCRSCVSGQARKFHNHMKYILKLI